MNIVMTVRQVALAVLARRKKWVALCIILGLLALVPAAWMLSHEPPRYRTTSVLLLEGSGDQLALIGRETGRDRRVAVQLAILRSRSLAEAVIDSVPKATFNDLIDNPYSRDYAQELQNGLRRLRGLPPEVESPHHRALQELQQSRVRFGADRRGRSPLVELTVEGSRPPVALDIANTYIEVLLARTRSFSMDDARVTREYLEQQYGQLTEAIKASEASLGQFTASRGGIKPPTQNAEAVARLGQLEKALAEVRANRQMSQSRLAAMKAKLDAMPAVAPPAPAPPKPAPSAAPAMQRVALLRGKLSGLERQLLEYETVYTDRHPRVVSTRQQIEDVTRELAEAVKNTPPVAAAATASAVPAQDRAAFAETVASLETQVQAVTAQEEALREQSAAVRRSLAGLNRDEMEYARLQTEVESNRRLQTTLSERLTAARIREQGEMRVVKVIDPPTPPVPYPNQKRIRFMAVALVAAFVLGAGIPGAFEYFNRPIQSEHDVRHLTGLPVLAVLPLVRVRRPVFFANGGHADELKAEEIFLFTEAFRRLRVEVQLLGRETPLRRILVASPLPGEGKSTVVVNLGLAFGEVGKHVILADADFQRPTLHRTLKTPNTRGFSDLLAGQADADVRESMVPVADGVWLAPRGGSSTAMSRSGLGSDRLTMVLDRLTDEADYILIDSSPTLLIPDNLYMAAAVDGVILVVQAGSTRPREMLRTKEIFDKAGTPIVGVVINQVPLRRMKQYHTYYKYYRSYVKADA